MVISGSEDVPRVSLDVRETAMAVKSLVESLPATMGSEAISTDSVLRGQTSDAISAARLALRDLADSETLGDTLSPARLEADLADMGAEIRELQAEMAPHLRGRARVLDDFLKVKVPAARMLVDTVWPAQAIGFIGGGPKSFKSFMAIELAFAVSTGKRFLTRYESHPHRVLLVQQESSFYSFQRRVGAVVKRYGPTTDLFIMSNVAIDLTNDGQAQKLEDEIRRVKPALVVLDPLASFFSGDENSAKEVGVIVRLLRKWRDDYETGICIVHHANKGNGTGRTGDKLRGTSALYGATEALIFVERKEDQSSLTSRVQMELKDGESPWPFEVALDRETTLLNVVTNMPKHDDTKPVPFWNQDDHHLLDSA